MRLLLSYAAGFDLGGASATLREPTTPQDGDVRDTLKQLGSLVTLVRGVSIKLNASIPLLKLKFGENWV